MRKSKLMRQVEKAWHRPLEELLPELLQGDVTASEVAEKLGIGKATLGYWLMRLGIRREVTYVWRQSLRRRIPSDHHDAGGAAGRCD